MGIVHSSYTNLEHSPFVDSKLTAWESGTEYVRFLNTTWCDVRSPDDTSAGNPIYKRKVLKVQGSQSGEVYYMSKESLVNALNSDLRETSKFVNSKKDYEVFCIWRRGFVQDKKGRTQEIQIAEPQRPVLGQLLLRHINV